MKTITVKAEHNYPVQVGVNSLHELDRIAKLHNKILVVAPKSLLLKLKMNLKKYEVFVTPEGEAQKNTQVLQRLWDKCAALGIQRGDALISLGGGATSDLVGFAAATWLRGVNWYAFPTSLAAMVDASGKNLIGSFYSPKEVLIDLKFVDSLSRRDFSAGMAEVIKCGFIADYKILNLVQDEHLDVEQIVYRAVKVKSDVVSKDFKESKLREILNYGHTLGHAIEKDSNYRMRHGEAVSVGMVFAAELSSELAGLSSDAVLLHRELSKLYNLPISYPRKRWPYLFKLIGKDKKTQGSSLRFIGISKIGKPVWFENVSPSLLAKVYERISK
jgi:3-dehydroquinate synthase